MEIALADSSVTGPQSPGRVRPAETRAGMRDAPTVPPRRFYAEVVLASRETGAYRPLRMSEYGEIDPRAGLGDCSCGHPLADHEWTSDGTPICSEGCECTDPRKDAQASEGDSGGR